jgi:secretion/DNA translocation related TadE-like protein
VSSATDLRPESGSATMWLTSMVVALGAVTLVLAHVGAALTERRLAQSAADLAALAGAAAVQHDRDGCARAAVIADRNGAALAACSESGSRVTVRVRRRIELPVIGAVPVTGRARAGPVESGPGGSGW